MAVAGALALPMAGATAGVAIDGGNCATDGVFASSFTFSECVGGYKGNLLNNSAAAVSGQINALSQFGFDTTGFDFNDYFKIDSLNGGDVTSPSAPMMYGETIFGIHFGGGSVIGNMTAFYKFDAGDGTSLIPFATKGSSGWVLYQTGDVPTVPEPASWALLIAGFGLVGLSVRRRRSAVSNQAAS